MRRVDRDRTQSIPLERFFGHLSFRYLKDDCHYLNADGINRINSSNELKPGIDCCAVCCKQPEGGSQELKACMVCRRVLYCGPGCSKRDKDHSDGCLFHQYIDETEGQHLPPAEIENLIASFSLSCKVVCEARGLGWGALKKAPLQFYGEDEEDVRAKKIARAAIALGPPVTAQQQPTDVQQQPVAEHQPALVQQPADVQQQTVTLAEQSSDSDDLDQHFVMLVKETMDALSRPTTIASFASGIFGVTKMHRIPEVTGPVVITIIGRVKQMLTYLSVWKVLDDLSPCGVVLQFVGWDVPASRHMKTEHISRNVRAAFFRGDLRDLANVIDDAGEEHLWSHPPLKPPAAPTSQGALSRFFGVQPAITTELLAAPQILVLFQPEHKSHEVENSLRCAEELLDKRCAHLREHGTHTVRFPCIMTNYTKDGLESDSVFMTEAGWKWTPRTMGNPWMSYRPVTDKYQANKFNRANKWAAVFTLTKTVKGTAPGPGTKPKQPTSLLEGAKKLMTLKGWSVAAGVTKRKKTKKDKKIKEQGHAIIPGDMV